MHSHDFLVESSIHYIYISFLSRGKTFFRVDLPAGLEAGKSVSVDIEAVFPMSLKPFPVEITQAEKQLVQFFGNLYFYSPYTTKTQTTTVNLASANVENYTKKKPVAQSESTITYGPYENRPAFSEVSIERKHLLLITCFLWCYMHVLITLNNVKYRGQLKQLS